MQDFNVRNRINATSVKNSVGRGFRLARRFGGVTVAGTTAFALALSSSTAQRWMGSAQLLSVQETVGDSCYRPSEDPEVKPAPAEDNTSLFDAIDQPTVLAQDTGGGENLTRPPVRGLWDTAPVFSSVGVDPVRNEVYLQDSNRWSIRVFGRLDNAKPGDPPTEPRRVISGSTSDVQFNSCVWVDPASGDIYSVENDTGDSIVVFNNRDAGDPAPKRKLKVTHRAQSMMLDPDNGELYLSVQYPPQVAVYGKDASGDDKPVRLIEGPKTRLSDAHGIALDTKNKLLYIANWGNVSDYTVAGSGRFEAPSISVYSSTATGDAAPLRVIQGPKTQLDWPGAMSIDDTTGDLYIANDMAHSLIVFRRGDAGDVAPTRVIKGNKTRLTYPAGVFVDSKNKEVWASNLGNATATVYPLNANGDVAPLRTIRGAEEGKVSLKFGKTEAVAYDSKRDTLWIPNCVMHPQIAIFNRTAGERSPPVRAVEGQKTLISRTMHGLMYDDLHDEVVVTSALAQAILTFKGDANGEQPPVRYIQGPHTQIQGTAYGANSIVTVDPVNGEIYLPVIPNRILVFDRTANGDVAPKRVLNGSPDQNIDGQTGVFVDPVHNLLLVNRRRGIYIYDRTASGDAKPKAIITGPKAAVGDLHQFAVTPKGWIIMSGGTANNGTGFVGAWNINDNGDVAPHWKIPVQQLTGYVPYSIVLDPIHKEMIMASAGRSNTIRPANGIMSSVITFSWPEIF